MTDNFEKLDQLLEQEQCEFVEIPDGFTGQTEDKTLRMIYLMNDAVESFLVLKNARLTGTYKKGYEGELKSSLEKQGADYVLAVHQGDSVFTVFFDDIVLEQQFYNYGSIGHFWVKKYENLRVLEYQIAILRDKYDYLGEETCTQEEVELAMLRDFPPLSYLFYPAVPEQYIVPVDNPWEVTQEALTVMKRFAREANDRKLYQALEKYEKNPSAQVAAKIAVMFRRKTHYKIVRLLADKIQKAARIYPDRDFGPEKNQYLQKLLQKAETKRKALYEKGIYSAVYREEPFVYDCDSISFQVYLLIQKNGFLHQKVSLERI